MSDRPWVTCPFCEGEYHRDSEHGVRECIVEAISDNRFRLEDADGWNDTADDILDMLKRRGVLAAAGLEGQP